MGYNNMIRSVITVIVIPLMLISCTTKDNFKVEISGTLGINVVEQINIFQEDNTIAYEQAALIGTDISDSLGRFKIKFNLKKPSILKLKWISGEISEIYIEPGQNLHVNIPENKAKGSASKYYDYNLKKQSIINEFNDRLGIRRHLDIVYNPLAKFDSLNTRLLDQLNNNLNLMSASLELSKTFVNIEKAKLYSNYAFMKNQYPRVYTYRTKGKEMILPKNYNNYWDKLLRFDSLALYDPYYKILVSSKGYDIGKAKNIKKPKHRDSVHYFYNQCYDMIKKDSNVFSNHLKEYVLARLIMSYLPNNGPNNVQSIISDYLSVYPTSSYSQVIKNYINKWNKLSPGKSAPKFSLKDMGNNEVTLDQFKGKNLFINVWSLSCPPCLKSIPELISFQKYAKQKYNIEFLNISIHNDQKKWREFLEKKKEFSGWHLTTNNGWQSGLLKDYSILWVPTYLIIDKNGKIVTINAPSPSEIQALDEILKSI